MNARLVVCSLVAASAASLSLAAPPAKDSVARGKELVTFLGCNDCHTPWKMGDKGPEPDMRRLLSGHPEGIELPPPPKAEGPWPMSNNATMTAWAGPWGISYSANLTPDRNTGLGVWTEAQFVKAMQTGKHFGTSRDILPPMPWQGYGKMPEADLKAIFAYLRSIPAITNHVPDAQLAPPPPAPPAAATQAK